eukprot:3491-Heterococcus_DN1.PRE.2
MIDALCVMPRYAARVTQDFHSCCFAIAKRDEGCNKLMCDAGLDVQSFRLCDKCWAKSSCKLASALLHLLACLHAAVTAAAARSASSLQMSDNEFDNYSSKVAFMFPGQGAQYVGMAASICDEVPAAKALFETANGILGYDLLDRCKNGPKEVLDSTSRSCANGCSTSSQCCVRCRRMLGAQVYVAYSRSARVQR